MSILRTPKIPIQANILLTTGLTMRDIKAEMLLCFVGTLLDDYYRLGATVEDEIFEDTTFPETKDTVDELHNYISTKVIKFHDVKKVINEAEENNRSMILAKGIEPMAIYLNFMIKAYVKHFKEGDQYIPDLLAILIIYHFKIENNKYFVYHPFIQNFDFSEYLKNSDEKNIQLKKQTMNTEVKKRIWQERTVIDKMSMVAEAIVKDYLTSQYKVMTTRVSKTRNKKKRK